MVLGNTLGVPAGASPAISNFLTGFANGVNNVSHFVPFGNRLATGRSSAVR